MKNPKNVYYSSEEELRKIGNLTLRQRNSILMNRELENAKRIIEQCEKHRISLLPIENPLYPKRAGNCNDAPIILYYKGTIQRMDKTVGIVGARRCTQERERRGKELVKNVNKAQDAYDIAEEEYNASKTLVESYKAEMDSYAASRNGTTWHDRQDAWQKKYDEARGDWETEKGNLGGKQKNYENAKNALTEAQSVLENYKDPQEKIIAEFLLEMLNVNPDPTILESYIEELNNRITELKTNTDIIGNYSELVADTQVLTVLVKNYVFWVKETSENDSEINTMLGELGKEIQIPDPDSQTFNEQYASWEETWQNRINCLENLIQELTILLKCWKRNMITREA